jgi:hypothetical protein
MLDSKYVIKNNQSGKFVSVGNNSSYTDQLQKAKLFDNYEEAKYHLCGNETAIKLTEIFEDYKNW